MQSHFVSACRRRRPALRPYSRAALPLTALTILMIASLAVADPKIGRSPHAPLKAQARLPAAGSQGSKADCAYTANSVAVLSSFERLVGRRFSCVMVFNNASPDWEGWEDPWFVRDAQPAYGWGRWASAADTDRQLIITQDLFPSALDGSDWLRAGAAGAFLGHARALARNLVAAGLGGSVIRLAPEANDSGSPDAIGSTDHQLQLWRTFWRRTVIAMRSVPGGHFLFDWCVNAYWRPIPLPMWYPGDDVVSIVGIDAYDSGVPPGEDRWRRIYYQPDGILDTLRFAKAHDKPISLPEWGLASRGSPTLGGGEDPAYVDGIARVVRSNRVAYQAYFYHLDSESLLAGSPLSLAAYRRHFGAGADSAGAPTISP